MPQISENFNNPFLLRGDNINTPQVKINPVIERTCGVLKSYYKIECGGKEVSPLLSRANLINLTILLERTRNGKYRVVRNKNWQDLI